MQNRRALIASQSRTVVWNQMLSEMKDSLWKSYNTSKTALSISEGVGTITWKSRGGGYTYDITEVTNSTTVTTGDKIYTSYMIKPDFGGGTWSYGYTSKIDAQYRIRVTAPAGVWTQVAGIMTVGGAGGTDQIFMVDLRNYTETAVASGSIVFVKAPISVNLTKMYGAGNEPTKEEFERQCRINGIDLTAGLAQNISGVTRTWRR